MAFKKGAAKMAAKKTSPAKRAIKRRRRAAPATSTAMVVSTRGTVESQPKRAPSPYKAKYEKLVASSRKAVAAARKRGAVAKDPLKTAGIAAGAGAAGQYGARMIQAKGQEKAGTDPNSFMAKFADPVWAAGVPALAGAVMAFMSDKLPGSVRPHSGALAAGLMAPVGAALANKLYDKRAAAAPAGGQVAGPVFRQGYNIGHQAPPQPQARPYIIEPANHRQAPRPQLRGPIGAQSVDVMARQRAEALRRLA